MTPKINQLRYQIGFATILLLCSVVNGFSQSSPIIVDRAEMQPHSYYTYNSIMLHDQLEIFSDSTKQMTIADIRNGKIKWQANQSRGNINSTGVYWAHIAIQSNKPDTLLFEFGKEKLSTWEDVAYYVFDKDSMRSSGVTGTSIKPANKTIRTALNLARIPLTAGITDVYCRLSGNQLITEDERWLARFHDTKREVTFFIHDESTFPGLEAYSFPGFYREGSRGHFFRANYFKHSLEVFVDKTKSKSIQDIDDQWDAYAGYKYESHPNRDSVYWMRFLVIGNDGAPGSYLFGPSSGTIWNFDTVEVYTQNNSGLWETQLTGNKVSLSAKNIGTDWNLFSVDVPPLDTQKVYLRLSGASSRFAPSFSMLHLDQTSFWPQLFTIQRIYGGFFSVLFVTALYFLILGVSEKRAVHFWYVTIIVGFALALGFLGADVNYTLLPTRSDYHPWLAAVGGFLIVFGLYNYTKEYLGFEKLYGININSILIPLIIGHFFICFYFAYSLYSIGGSIAIYEGYFKLFIGSIGFNFLFAIVLGIISLCRGNRYAKFFVMAFGTIVVLLIIRMMFAFGSFSSAQDFDQGTVSTGLYIHYMLLHGIVAAIILLAFGNGYRVNQLKIAASDAAFKSQQKESINLLLVEKNKLIESRAEEKELLVQEIHHRVKNNLQILASLLNLQSDYITDEAAYNVILESKERVETMGLIHQLLYLGDSGVPSIDMQLYLDELCSYYQNSFIADQQKIRINNNVEVENLDIDTAIPIGLTITELVTNSKKHGFGDNRDGYIDIHLWINDVDQLCLEVRDNGIGVEQDALNTDPKSFGTELIRLLTKKLKGSIRIKSEKGYSTLITYKKFRHNSRLI